MPSYPVRLLDASLILQKQLEAIRNANLRYEKIAQDLGPELFAEAKDLYLRSPLSLEQAAYVVHMRFLKKEQQRIYQETEVIMKASKSALGLLSAMAPVVSTASAPPPIRPSYGGWSPPWRGFKTKARLQTGSRRSHRAKVRNNRAKRS